MVYIEKHCLDAARPRPNFEAFGLGPTQHQEAGEPANLGRGGLSSLPPTRQANIPLSSGLTLVLCWCRRTRSTPTG